MVDASVRGRQSRCAQYPDKTDHPPLLLDVINERVLLIVNVKNAVACRRHDGVKNLVADVSRQIIEAVRATTCASRPKQSLEVKRRISKAKFCIHA